MCSKCQCSPYDPLHKQRRDGNATDWWLQQQSNGPAFSIRLTASVSVLQDVIKIKRLRFCCKRNCNYVASRISTPNCIKQELSYRKHIARQLRTQFVDGISVTLKSTLRVTQGHWKRNHWTDHTRLTVRRVIGGWILSWPWNVDQRSLKVIESGTIWKFGYGFLTFPTLTLTITLTLTLGVKVIENGAVR